MGCAGDTAGCWSAFACPAIAGASTMACAASTNSESVVLVEKILPTATALCNQNRRVRIAAALEISCRIDLSNSREHQAREKPCMQPSRRWIVEGLYRQRR